MKIILEVITTHTIKNDETHKLLIEAQTEVDEEKRNELYKQAQEIIHEDAPWVPLAHSTPFLAGKADITGFLTASNRFRYTYRMLILSSRRIKLEFDSHKRDY